MLSDNIAISISTGIGCSALAIDRGGSPWFNKSRYAVPGSSDGEDARSLTTDVGDSTPVPSD